MILQTFVQNEMLGLTLTNQFNTNEILNHIHTQKKRCKLKFYGLLVLYIIYIPSLLTN